MLKTMRLVLHLVLILAMLTPSLVCVLPAQAFPLESQYPQAIVHENENENKDSPCPHHASVQHPRPSLETSLDTENSLIHIVFLKDCMAIDLYDYAGASLVAKTIPVLDGAFDYFDSYTLPYGLLSRAHANTHIRAPPWTIPWMYETDILAYAPSVFHITNRYRI